MKNLIYPSLFILLLNACAQPVQRSEALIFVEEHNIPNAESKSVRQVESTVIASLINDANKQAISGNTEQAAAIIERGLRIEPTNAGLWNLFASIRLQQQQWQQAIELARKSNALTNDKDLLSSNWGLMAKAYEKTGEYEKAKEALKKQKLTS